MDELASIKESISTSGYENIPLIILGSLIVLTFIVIPIIHMWVVWG